MLPNEAEKKRIKAAYRSLGDEVVENEDDMVKPESDLLVSVLTRGNELFRDVKTAVEGTEDSKLMAQIAVLGKRKIQELRTESNHFRAAEFAEKLKAYTLQGEKIQMTGDHWSSLGNALQSFFKRPPSFSFLLGSFHKQPPPKKEKNKRVKLKDDNSKDKQTNVIKVVDDQKALETTAHDVSKRVLPELISLYNHNDQEPLDYYEFVIDPDSFGVTIENMFHVSFLIRDGLAEIKLDGEGLPTILPTIYGLDGSLEGRERDLQSKPRRQVISQLTIQQWKELKSLFKITKARIPRRSRS